MDIRKFCMAMAIVLTGLCTVSCGGGGDDVTPTPVNGGGNNGNGGGNSGNGGANTSQGTMQLTRTCSTCSGSKLCVDCNGTGKGCKTCGGTGKYCKECGTTGECGYCYGSGVCQRCNGKKGEECSKCKSNPGKCWQCGGRKVWGNDKCLACNGSGVCNACHGNYWKECSSCSGSGDCSYCRGNKICQTCKGNPTCKTCGGDGHCTTCNNSDGKCKDCNGSGETNLTSFSFTESGGNEKIFIHSTSAWTVSSDADWIKLSLTSGSGDNTITVTADANNTASERSGSITFTYGNSNSTIKVTQGGEPAKLSTDASSVFVYSNGTGGSITIKSNTSWTIKAADSWVTCSPASGSGDATVSVSASAYTAGTRYSTLTITDTTGEMSSDVSVVQAESPDAMTALKNWLEKPLGVVNVDLKTASYQTIRDEVEKLFKIDEGKYSSGNPYIYVWASDNDACRNMTYQGLPFYWMSISQSKYYKTVSYDFRIDVSKASNDYTSYLNSILQDFKYTMNVSLEKGDNGNFLACYRGYDGDKNEYSLYVSEDNYSEDYHKYIFEIDAYYK